MIDREPREQRGRGGRVRVDQRKRRYAVRGERRPRVEPDPPDPEQRRAGKREDDVVWPQRRTPKVPSSPEHDRRDQAPRYRR